MKNLTYKLILLLLIAFGKGYGFSKLKGNYPFFASQKDSIRSIQMEIDHLFSKSLELSSLKPLEQYSKGLAANKEGYAENSIRYWQAYTAYQKAVYSLIQENLSASEESCDFGIDLLNRNDNKNSEDYALLANIEAFSIQFKGAKVLVIAPRLRKHARKAIALDSLNLRAYYVLGSNDYYTPKQYGGGKKTEFYLKKALSIPPKRSPNSLSPNWGREGSYALLAQFYLKENFPIKAQDIINEGLLVFPESYQLKNLLKKL